MAFHRRLPQWRRKHMRSTNALERLDEEIGRRAHVARIFPDVEGY